MERTALSFDVLLGYMQQAIASMKDPRRPSNATRYSLKEVVLGAFACFFMQSESFLEHQRHLHSRCGQDNTQTLFGLEKIPTVEQIRNLLDKLAVHHLFVVFEWVYRALNGTGLLRRERGEARESKKFLGSQGSVTKAHRHSGSHLLAQAVVGSNPVMEQTLHIQDAL